MAAPGTFRVTIVASEAVFAACPVSGAAVSIRFFVRFGLVIGFDRHKIGRVFRFAEGLVIEAHFGIEAPILIIHVRGDKASLLKGLILFSGQSAER